MINRCGWQEQGFLPVHAGSRLCLDGDCWEVAHKAGSFAAGAVIGRSLRTVYVTAAVLVAAVVGLLNTLTGVAPAVVVLVMIWGAAFGAVPCAADMDPAREPRGFLAGSRHGLQPAGKMTRETRPAAP